MKKKIFATMLTVAILALFAFGLTACNKSPSITPADIEGEWILYSYLVNGTSEPTFFRAITFTDDENTTDTRGVFTATLPSSDYTFNGIFHIIANDRVQLAAEGHAALNHFFVAYEYRIRFSGSSMIWDWYLLGNRQNVAFTWSPAPTA